MTKSTVKETGSKARTETPTLTAGRALDALIAERVFGLVRCTGCDYHECYAFPASQDHGGELRAYSTDIAAAWEVVEKVMERDGTYFELERNSVRGTQWRITLMPLAEPIATGMGSTAPLAICRAALRLAENV